MIFIKLFIIGCLLLVYSFGVSFVFLFIAELLEDIFKKAFEKSIVIFIWRFNFNRSPFTSKAT